MLELSMINGCDEFQQNCYLAEKIREAETDTDTRILTHEEVWGRIKEAFDI